MTGNQDLIALTADIVSSHVANNSVAVGDVGNLVQRVYEALAGLGAPVEEPPQPGKIPVVSVRASIRPEYLVCMECGRKQKTLKRHLQTAHGMSPAQYRKDYGLPDSYPMVSPSYSETRSAMAKAIGFGTTGRGRKAAAPAQAGSKKGSAAPRGRRPKKAAPAEGSV